MFITTLACVQILSEVDALGKSDFLQKEALKGVLVTHTEVAPKVVNTNRRVYIEELWLQPLSLSLMYTPVGRHKEIKQISGTIRRVLNTFGGFAKIDTDIRLNSFIAKKVADNSNMFVNRVAKHYIDQLVTQVVRVVFGLQTLGNPLKLFSNIGTGVKQLYYEPSQGLGLGAKDFMAGWLVVRRHLCTSVCFLLVVFFFFKYLMVVMKLLFSNWS